MGDTPAMTFQRFGRSHHLRIATAADLARATELDEAHWVAAGAPIETISCDATFLALLDTDDNGRIMCAELTEGIGWLLATLRDRTGIDQRSGVLRREAIDTDTGEGQRIHMSAGKMLARLGRDEAGEISLEQVRRIKAQVEGTPVSEAGVVLPEAAKDGEVRQFLADVIAAVGGAPHPGGTEGVGQEQLEAFLSLAAAAVAWHERGLVPPGQDKTDVMPLGERTPSAYEALTAVRAKMDQYFAQCEALALDERFAQRMGWTDEELEELDFDHPAVIENVLRKAPLARARADRRLRLDEETNPYYAAALARFHAETLQGILGSSGQAPAEISATRWQKLKGFFAEHQAWAEARPDAKVLALGVETLRAYLDERFARCVRELIAESRRTAFDLDNIRLTEKLILYQAYMIDFANNFVSFPHLYDPASRAMFEMGTLVMDGRRFHLAVRVKDRAEHAKIAKTSNMCLLYVQVSPRDGGATYEVAVPVTSGGIGNLCLSKRGIFHDPADRECDATVASIIENPISLAEALVSPFRRLGRLLTGKIESLTTEAEKKLDAKAAAAVGQVAAAPAPGKVAAPRPAGPTGGTLMGLGVAGAAVGSALAYITKTLAETHPVAILVGVLGAVLLVILPISIVAWLKLRRRDLSAILEGSGWAINARMRLTRKQSRYFTDRPRYPAGARGVRRIPWGAVIAAAVLLGAFIAGGVLVRRHLRSCAGAASQPASAPAKK